MIRWLLLIFLLLPLHSAVAQNPQLLGYGVKPCGEYLAAYEGWEEGREEQIGEYLRFRDWLTGFISALSLAAGDDVLRGVEIGGAMRRIQLHCDEHPADDFFSATRALIRLLSMLEMDATDSGTGNPGSG